MFLLVTILVISGKRGQRRQPHRRQEHGSPFDRDVLDGHVVGVAKLGQALQVVIGQMPNGWRPTWAPP